MALFYPVVSVILLCLTLMTGEACAVETGDADHYFVRGDWKKASSAYEPVIAGSCGPEVLLHAAEANYRAGLTDRSEELARQVLEKGENVDAGILLSLIKARRGRAEDAVRGLEGLRRTPAQEHKVITAMCVIRKATDTAAAISLCNRATELDPDDFWAWFTIGLIYEEEESFEQATKAYTQAVRISPMNAQAQNNLGYSYKERHYYAYAVNHYLKAIELMPDHPGFYYNIGNAYAHQEKVGEAFSAYRKALDLDQAFAKAHYNLARMYLRMDMVLEAIGEFSLYLEHGDKKIFKEVASRSAVEGEIEDLELYLKLNPDGRPRAGDITR